MHTKWHISSCSFCFRWRLPVLAGLAFSGWWLVQDIASAQDLTQIPWISGVDNHAWWQQRWSILTLVFLLLLQFCIIALLAMNVTMRKMAEKELHAHIQEEMWLSEHLRALSVTIYRLASTESEADLCRTAVLEAQERLGFSRIGIWILDEKGHSFRGTFGVDRHGAIRDERGETIDAHPDSDVGKDFRRARSSYDRQENKRFYDLDGVYLGTGTQVMVRLFLQDQLIGFISCDDLLEADPISENAAELLSLFANALAQLLARKWAEAEQARMQQQVNQSQKMESLGVLAGGIAHDFNNILMGMLGNAAMILSDKHLTPDTHRHARNIEKEARRAVDLTAQMLAYSGKGKFVIDTLHLPTLLSKTRSVLEATLPSQAILDLDWEDALPPMEGDAAQIRQVIMNLVSNAAEALNNEKGMISVRVRKVNAGPDDFHGAVEGAHLGPGEYICLEVRDTGVGMDAETLKQVFDPFFTTRFFGRGLGLSAVLGIVRGHHGGIRIESTPQSGTLAEVFFPIAQKSPVLLQPVDYSDRILPHEQEIESASGETESLPVGVAGEKTVLVVDDEPVVLDITREMLETAGFAVLTARDGIDAIEVFEKNVASIDLILLDLTMPRMDGEQTLKEIRRSYDVPIVVASGYNKQEVTSRFAGRDVAGFIQKPYNMKTLRETVQDALSGSSA